ncbi:MAG: NUDIX domain-containing protein [Pseudomonadales bacterium]|nr:NUDIX domain-containing protein [Pseudomonadales bacterium]
MAEILPNIRNAVRALIVRENKVLLLKKEDDKGPRFALPGGGQDTGETLEQALQRECQEEIGSAVMVRDLLHVADYFRDRPTKPATIRHLVEFLFVCDVPEDYQPHNGPHPDKHQVDVVWADIENLTSFPIFPKSLVAHLTTFGKPQQVYVGAV